jgi:hypothetical protein
MLRYTTIISRRLQTRDSAESAGRSKNRLPRAQQDDWDRHIGVHPGPLLSGAQEVDATGGIFMHTADRHHPQISGRSRQDTTPSAG